MSKSSLANVMRIHTSCQTDSTQQKHNDLQAKQNVTIINNIKSVAAYHKMQCFEYFLFSFTLYLIVRQCD